MRHGYLTAYRMGVPQWVSTYDILNNLNLIHIVGNWFDRILFLFSKTWIVLIKIKYLYYKLLIESKYRYK